MTSSTTSRAEPELSPAVRPARTPIQTVTALVEQYALVIVLMVVTVVFAVMRPQTFGTVTNLQSVISDQSVLAVVALAAVVPFAAGQFDLSVAATLGLSSLVCAALMSRSGLPLWLAVAVAVAVGATVGLVNGLVVAGLGVNSIITTLGTGTIVAGMVLWYTKGESISTGISPLLLDVGPGSVLGIPYSVIVVAVIALLVAYFLRSTPTGRHVYAVGINERASKLVGLAVRRIKMLAFVIAGMVAALAGVLQVGVIGSASPQVGPNFLLPALTAVFLGATTIRPGQYNVPGTLVAVLFLAVTVSGLAMIGAPGYLEPIFSGGALIVAVALSTVLRRRRMGES